MGGFGPAPTGSSDFVNDFVNGQLLGQKDGDVNILDDLRDMVGRIAARSRDELWARREKAEGDTERDRSVAGNRGERDGAGGSYVGRTSPQYDAETQESGAEARAEADRDGG